MDERKVSGKNLQCVRYRLIRPSSLNTANGRGYGLREGICNKAPPVVKNRKQMAAKSKKFLSDLIPYGALILWHLIFATKRQAEEVLD